MVVIIYKITNIINNKVYIGKTEKETVNRRWITHRHKLKKGIHDNNHFQASYNKYGKDSFQFEVIEKDISIDINKKEMYYIELYNSNNRKFGYNKSSGGEGVSGIPMPLKTREALKKANTGRKLTEYQKEALLKSNKERIYSEETIELFKRRGKERALTETFKKLVYSNGVNTYNRNKNIFIEANEKRKKTVLCLNNNIIYHSLTEAATALNLDKTNISRVASGKQKQIKGYTFKFI